MSGFYAIEDYGLGFESASRETVVRTYSFPAPAAGSEWTITVPTPYVWMVASLSVTLTTSNQPATRTPVFRFSYMGADFYNTGAVNALAATNAATFTLATDIGYSASLAGGSQQTLGIPLVLLPAGSTISSTTVGLQTNDVYGPQSVYVRVALVGALGSVSPADEPGPEPLATPILV